MKTIWLIFQREYLTRVKKKSFIFTTLLVPISFILLFVVQFILMAYSSEKMRIAIKDDSGQIKVSDRKDGTLYFFLEKKSLADLREYYQDMNYDGVLHIPDLDIKNPNGIKYYSDNLLGMSAKYYIENEIEKEIRRLRLQNLGLEEKDFNNSQKVSISLNEVSLAGKNNIGTGIATSVGFAMAFLMYIVIFIYGAMVMKGVMEEKTNRIVEVMLSSVRPFQLMIGKITGIGAVGITQFTIWIVLLFFINSFLSLFMLSMFDMPTTANGVSESEMQQAQEMIEQLQTQFTELPLFQLIVSFIIYFIGGYLLYAALFAGLGSAVNDDSDAQTLTFPVSVPIIIAIFILTAIMERPNSSLAFWSSMIPFFSPIIMPFRIAFGVPIWELLLSMTLLLGGALFAIWIAAKIYRVGILMYGKKVTFSEIARWMLRS